jgi:hypothetical protein
MWRGGVSSAGRATRDTRTTRDHDNDALRQSDDERRRATTSDDDMERRRPIVRQGLAPPLTKARSTVYAVTGFAAQERARRSSIAALSDRKTGISS